MSGLLGSAGGSRRAGLIYIAVSESRIVAYPDPSPGIIVEGGAALWYLCDLCSMCTLPSMA